jgi:hypothetical protein
VIRRGEKALYSLIKSHFSGPEAYLNLKAYLFVFMGYRNAVRVCSWLTVLL